ncbi:Glu-tRNA(Gln) amidotransferase subunit GatD [Methanonatronarchaeum sp. AMET6-2]|nr:Glu-tRNA(Gln) amidotransferase subunit GatD [Methanonatronarchaeum sp. AMET6-2]UOY10409.1 Glu-tRNA(Gln) amidotransferase subunit GatD [Methanonatronarchaeum sp. AMET6-2]
MTVKDLLDSNDINFNDKVRLVKGEHSYVGRVLPSSKQNTLVLKLTNGYNIGLDITGADIQLIERKVDKQKDHAPDRVVGDDQPDISMLLTGGTIASRVDYRTGAVTSDFSMDELLSAIPELEGMANYRSKVVSNILSENIKPEDWIDISKAIYSEIENGADGVVVAHGTDTMAYTATAVSFLIQTPVPVVFVGSQRSADRPSSDNVLNVVSAVKLAKSNIAEVMVVMHGETSDTYCQAHLATKTRKMHTSRRDAFKSINSKPIATIKDEVTPEMEYTRRGEKQLEYNGSLNPNCGLFKFTPATKPKTLKNILVDMDGVVIEGTGLGHVSSDLIPVIKREIDNGTPIVMASQCLYGRVCDRVYDTGRDLLKAGVIPARDMLPETALVKLMWCLDKTGGMERVRELMHKDIAGEINERTLKNTYPME